MSDKEIKNAVAEVVEEKKTSDYYTVGKLREVLKDISDETPIAALPFNDDVRVTIDISIVPEAKIGDYLGKAVLFITGLFDNKTGKEITLSNEEEN